MFQDLTTAFPAKLGREALSAHLPTELIADLYPTGSWRDHWPGEAVLTLLRRSPISRTFRWTSRNRSCEGPRFRQRR